MAYLSKLAALTMLSATSVLGAACAATDEAPLPATEIAVSEPINECSEAMAADAAMPPEDLYSGDEAQEWGNRWHYCRPWRRCVYQYGYRACSRWMPERAYYCAGYPGGGYPGYPGYPPGGPEYPPGGPEYPPGGPEYPPGGPEYPPGGERGGP